MVVDGVELLRMIRENKFDDGDKIRAEITANQDYIYSAYFRNFLNTKTSRHLAVTDYILWTFEILSEENKEIDIQAIEELKELDDKDFYAIPVVINRKAINELIKAVKQLDKKQKEENNG